jgi:ribosome-associated toxin RatA of RatAB toxin-antitoxin module
VPTLQGTHAELIAAPRDACVAVLLEVAAYPRWYDTLDAVSVRRRDPEGRPAHVLIAADAGPLGALELELEYVYDLPGAIAARQIGGDGSVKELSSRWTLEPVTADTTRATYAFAASAASMKTRAAFRVAGPLIAHGLIDAFPKALQRHLARG